MWRTTATTAPSGLAETAAALTEKALSKVLEGEADWGLNMDLVDIIAADEQGAGPASLRVIASALYSRPPEEQKLALTLVETIVKNSGPALHNSLQPSGALAAIVRLATSESEASEKALGIIQQWGEQLGDRTQSLHEAYAALKAQGVAFPLRSVGSEMAPVLTPPPSNPEMSLDGLAEVDRAAIEQAIAEAELAEHNEVLAQVGTGHWHPQRAATNPFTENPSARTRMAQGEALLQGANTSIASRQNLPLTADDLPASTPTPPTEGALNDLSADEFHFALNSAEVLAALLSDIPNDDPTRVFDEVVDELVNTCSRTRERADRVLANIDAYGEQIIDAVLASHEAIVAALESHKSMVAKAQQGVMIESAMNTSSQASRPTPREAPQPLPPPPPPPPPSLPDSSIPQVLTISPPPENASSNSARGGSSSGASIMELSSMASLHGSRDPGSALASLLDLDPDSHEKDGSTSREEELPSSTRISAYPGGNSTHDLL